MSSAIDDVVGACVRSLQTGSLGLRAGGQRAGAAERVVAGHEVGELLALFSHADSARWWASRT